MAQNKEKRKRIALIKEKRDSLNDLLEKSEETKTQWYDSDVSPDDMKSIRKIIRRDILQRDKCDDELDEIGEVKLIMTPI